MGRGVGRVVLAEDVVPMVVLEVVLVIKLDEGLGDMEVPRLVSSLLGVFEVEVEESITIGVLMVEVAGLRLIGVGVVDDGVTSKVPSLMDAVGAGSGLVAIGPELKVSVAIISVFNADVRVLVDARGVDVEIGSGVGSARQASSKSSSNREI